MKQNARRPSIRRIAVGALLATALAGALSTRTSAAHLQTVKIVVLLCKFQDAPTPTQDVSYYKRFYSNDGQGLRGAFDYWTEVSYGRLSLEVTVTDWIDVPMKQYQFTGGGSKPEDCAPHGNINLSDYDGVIVTPNLGLLGNPDWTQPVMTNLTAEVHEGETTIEVASSTGFPELPFPAWLGGVYVDGVNVTAISGNTWTVQRDYPDSRQPKEHAADDPVVFFNVARNQGTTGTAWLPADVHMNNAAHEMIHLLGFLHSRKLSTSTTDYNDCFDIASSNCNVFGPDPANGVQGGFDLDPPYNGGLAGPGMNAVNLDEAHWLDENRKITFDKDACNVQTFTVAALNHAEAAGLLAVRIPAQVQIQNSDAPTFTTSQAYYVSFRHKSGWDVGIPEHAVVLHLDGGGDGHSYWVDTAAPDGALGAGESFSDAAQNVYVSVNRIDGPAKTALVTIGGCMIPVVAALSGNASGSFGDTITLAADLTVSGSGAPVPNADVTLSVGTQSCPAGAKTDLAGHVSCTITLNQVPGTYVAQVTYAGDAAYLSTDASHGFTINKAATQAVLSGDTSGDYGDAITLAADLTASNTGAPIQNADMILSLGSQSCPAGTSTDNTGHASCSITLNQTPGSYAAHVSYAGNEFYQPSSASASFTINKEQTALVIGGNTFIAVGDPVSAVLTEVDGAPLAGRNVLFTLAGQTCTGTTDNTGTATCTIPAASLPLGPRTLTATFAGDVFYLGSSEQKSVTTFAWTTGGNFVIGDGNAVVGTTATFWADDWQLRNVISGGAAPASFKGFANTPAGRTACGGAWSSSGGNSPPPAGSVPEYTAILVTSQVTKAGLTITGTMPYIVIVRVNPGYAPKPGRTVTASVLGFYC